MDNRRDERRQLAEGECAVNYQLHHGDCIDYLKSQPANSIDAGVQDPPAGIDFMAKDWDNLSNHGAKTERGLAVLPALDSLMTLSILEKWEAGFLLFTVDWASEELRIMKPGGHSLTWAIPRTSDLTKFGLRLAGWEIFDTVYHVFGSGFPKSMDMQKAIDRSLGQSGEYGEYKSADHAIKRKPGNQRMHEGYQRPWRDNPEIEDRNARQYFAATAEAAQWHGYGTALKPAAEEWILARKPIDGTYAENALKWGVGGLAIDACRVPIADGATMARNNKPGGNGWKNSSGGANSAALHGEPSGRWPANVIHDGSDEVAAEFDKAGATGGKWGKQSKEGTKGMFGVSVQASTTEPFIGDTGSAARFFYCAKASSSERHAGVDGDNNHPTPKSLELMRYLCRLVKPPTGGILIDPFMGSGSTIVAALLEGYARVIGVEQMPLPGKPIDPQDNPDYFGIAKQRIKHWEDEYSVEPVRIVGKPTDLDALPLFA